MENIGKGKQKMIIKLIFVLIWEIIKLVFEWKEISNKRWKFLKIVILVIDMAISLTIMYYITFIFYLWLMFYDNYKYFNIVNIYVIIIYIFLMVLFIMKNISLLKKNYKKTTAKILIVISTILEIIILINMIKNNI